MHAEQSGQQPQHEHGPPPPVRRGRGVLLGGAHRGHPMGLGLPHPPPTVLRAPPGTRLLMITDGLVEIRTALARFGHNKDDDIALIAALFT
ncbi:SpoIIE family protein phosphatase [Streptomyces sp. NPDC056660]|uniref:SpoIIE family protein phosphatase n=1 Tax=Streptomyces sp. NPDC056660 TaxID=3345897 RepID=UPI0036B7529C